MAITVRECTAINRFGRTANRYSVAINTPACQQCLQDDCGNLLQDCTGDSDCTDAVITLSVCVCDPKNDTDDCKATFAKDGGDPALKLIECFDTSCAEVCQ